MNAKDLIDYAISQIGTAEDPLGSNKQKYGAMLDELPWYLRKEGDKEWIHKVNGFDWCTSFVDASFIFVFSLDSARKMLFRPSVNDYGSVVKYAFNYFKNAGHGFKKEDYNPKPGDVIYFQNDEGLSHTGIVIDVSDSNVTTVEGNSGKNCWYVAKSTYSKTYKKIYGYGCPDYEEPDPDPKELDGFKVGDTYEVICNDPLMIRKGPGTSYAKVGELKKGDKIVCKALRHDASLNTWLEHDKGWSCGLYQGQRYMDDPTQTGWIQKDGKWYYYDDNGNMVKNKWQLYKGQWYYLGSDGAMMADGWQTINDKKYYLYADGHRAAMEWIDGLFLDGTGQQTYTKKGSWKKDSKGKYFKISDGQYLKDRCMRIDKKDYTFDKNGYAK